MIAPADRISLRRAADILGKSKIGVYYHVSHGRIPSEMVDGRLYLSRALVERLQPFVEQRGLAGAVALLHA